MKITGKWQIAEAELAGKPLAKKDLAGMTLELDETSYQLIDKMVIDSGIIEPVAGARPAALRITGVFGPNKGKTFYCIYRFEKQDLIMCYNLGKGPPPASFVTQEQSLLYLVRYRRLK